MSTTIVKRKFTFRIVYFKPSGKFYIEKKVRWTVRDCGTPKRPTAYMYEATDRIQELRDSGGLPGLCGEGWDGPILVECKEGFPVLVMPVETKE